MRIKTTVTKIETYGGRLHVTLEKQSAYSGERDEQKLIIPDTQTARFAYRVGRPVSLSTQPL